MKAPRGLKKTPGVTDCSLATGGLSPGWSEQLLAAQAISMKIPYCGFITMYLLITDQALRYAKLIHYAIEHYREQPLARTTSNLEQNHLEGTLLIYMTQRPSFIHLLSQRCSFVKEYEN